MRKFDIKNVDDCSRWLRHNLWLCAENCCASYSEENVTDFVDDEVTHLHFSTGGWSGAESLIGVIEDQLWLLYHMKQWRRGGHYIFELPGWIIP